MSDGLSTILIVDDDSDILEAMAELLTDSGYQVQPASSGQAALGVLRAGLRPAIMVVDYAMPDINGLELLDACSELPELDDVPVLMTSAFRTGEIPTTPRVSFLHKPFSMDDLLGRIHGLIGERRGVNRRDSNP
jgi:CheY-like chemotaxis protein